MFDGMGGRLAVEVGGDGIGGVDGEVEAGTFEVEDAKLDVLLFFLPRWMMVLVSVVLAEARMPKIVVTRRRMESLSILSWLFVGMW